jgi:glycosyltransferase involved in cell wall biosynthesis
LNLAFLSPTYPHRGGIARYGSCLLGALQRRHHCLGISFNQLYPAWLFPGKGQNEWGDLPSDGAQGEPLLHYARPSSWRQISHLMKNDPPDGLIITWWVTFWALHFGWLARQISAKTNLIYLCHNVLPHERRFYDTFLTRFALSPAHRFIVHSQENLIQLQNLFPNATIIRREHPVYTSANDDIIDREAARRKLDIHGKMLLFFGLIRPYKGVDVAIQALGLLKERCPDLTLWIAGEFWEGIEPYRKLITKFHLDSRVRIEPGYLSEEELTVRVRASDAVVLPYRSATGSGVLATAFAHNRPVIATRCGCFKEMVKPGVTGLLCEPGDPASLADAIAAFYNGGNVDRFDAGLAEARTSYTWDSMVDTIEELLNCG